MKLSRTTLLLMATSGLVTSTVVVNEIKECSTPDFPSDYDPSAGTILQPPPSLSDRYYLAKQKARKAAIKYGLLPPPPPCGMCGMG